VKLFGIKVLVFLREDKNNKKMEVKWVSFVICHFTLSFPDIIDLRRPIVLHFLPSFFLFPLFNSLEVFKNAFQPCFGL
jgi:hypothetical protein